jgi:glycosyltransferase involved in cell wall biosynthesis
MGIYNGAEYLDRSVESVLSQESVDLELVLVDDESTDQTPTMLADYMRRDPRVRIITQAHAGLTMALIRGCAAARGELIARQDADDMSLPGRLEMQASELGKRPELALVSSWVEVIGPRDEVLYARTPSASEEDATRSLLDGLDGPVHGSVMFRRALYEEVGGYRAAFRYAQDSDLWRRLTQRGLLGCIRRVLYRSRVHDGAISASRATLQAEFDRLAQLCCAARLAGRDEEVFLGAAEELSARLISDKLSRQSVAYFIGRCLLSRRDPRARGYLLEALRQQPGDLRVWASLAQALMTRS